MEELLITKLVMSRIVITSADKRKLVALPSSDCASALWSEASVCACRHFASLAIQNLTSEDSDQIARMHRLILANLSPRFEYTSKGTFFDIK